ncbi:hypothetical protein L345_11732, partial [Ophiophagus hannah]
MGEKEGREGGRKEGRKEIREGGRMRGRKKERKRGREEDREGRRKMGERKVVPNSHKLFVSTKKALVDVPNGPTPRNVLVVFLEASRIDSPKPLSLRREERSQLQFGLPPPSGKACMHSHLLIHLLLLCLVSLYAKEEQSKIHAEGETSPWEGDSQRCFFRRQLDFLGFFFSFEDVSLLIQEASSALTGWWGTEGFLLLADSWCLSMQMAVEPSLLQDVFLPWVPSVLKTGAGCWGRVIGHLHSFEATWRFIRVPRVT